ncbi:MAG: hypothetical protein ACRCUS_07680, partial [Anaerovoracaceae bacterium]
MKQKGTLKVLTALILSLTLAMGLSTTSSFAATKAKEITLTTPSKSTYIMYKGTVKTFKYK